MGLHPNTEGYFTKDKEGYECVEELPQLPDWILSGVLNKNVKLGKPAEQSTRIVGPGFAINAKISLERDIQLAQEATWALPPYAADDFDLWLTVGQSLHSLDDSLLSTWDEWSKQSEKYIKGECQKRWHTFSKEGGRGLGSLIHAAQENGWQPSQDHKILAPSNESLDFAEQLLNDMDLELNTVNLEKEDENTVGTIRCMNVDIAGDLSAAGISISDADILGVFPKGGPKQKTWLDLRIMMSNTENVIEIGIIDIPGSVSEAGG